MVDLKTLDLMLFGRRRISSLRSISGWMTEDMVTYHVYVAMPVYRYLVHDESFVYINTEASPGALFLPFAISSTDLLRRVKDALLEDHPEGLNNAGIQIPSLSWLQYQFAPANSGYRAAMHNTGKLQVKHKVQVRTLRQTHIDSHYCAAMFKYMKGLCLELAKTIRDSGSTMVVRFVSMDDKAKVSAWLPTYQVYVLAICKF